MVGPPGFEPGISRVLRAYITREANAGLPSLGILPLDYGPLTPVVTLGFKVFFMGVVLLNYFGEDFGT